jgi:hypothetical protein
VQIPAQVSIFDPSSIGELLSSNAFREVGLGYVGNARLLASPMLSSNHTSPQLAVKRLGVEVRVTSQKLGSMMLQVLSVGFIAACWPPALKGEHQL